MTEEIQTTAPAPVYNFIVDIDGDKIPFKSVSGLNATQKIVYRDGARGLFQMPNLYEAPDVILTTGVFKGQPKVYDWLNTANLKEVDKKDVLVQLLDPAGGQVILGWRLINAFPTAISASELNADTNEIAIVTVTLACDRVDLWAPEG